jgi:CRP-like cAMP-binding protein
MAQSAAQALTLFLARITERSVLSAEEVLAIKALPTRAKSYADGQDIVRLGQTVSHACLVGEGIAARFAETSAGERQIVALHIPGDMADLHSVVSPQVVSPLQAIGRTLIHRIPHWALRKLATRYPAIAFAFWRDGIIDAAIIGQAVLNLGRKKAPARIAHVVCELAVRSKAGKAPSLSFPLAINQLQLAQVVGLHPVHVNRTLGKLKTDRLLVLDGKRAQILNWPALVSLAEFDSRYLQYKRIDFEADAKS